MKRLAISVLLGLLLVSLALLIPAYAAGEDGARDAITATTLANSGITMTLSAASGDGHSFTNTGREFIVVTNDYTAAVTLTIVTGGTVGGLDIEDVDVAVATDTTKIIGPFSPSLFNQSGTTDTYLNFDAAVTGTVAVSVTLAAYKME